MMAYEWPFGDVSGVTDVADVTIVVLRRPEWVAHVLDEASDPPRAVLLHLPSGRRIALSDSGTRVWQVIVASGAEGTNGVNIGQTLGPEYGVEPTLITRDIAGLLTEMLEGEWLEAVPPHKGGEGT